jgi:hypothetical protein
MVFKDLTLKVTHVGPPITLAVMNVFTDINT